MICSMRDSIAGENAVTCIYNAACGWHRHVLELRPICRGAQHGILALNPLVSGIQIQPSLGGLIEEPIYTL
jgi:hypothetical protein